MIIDLVNNNTNIVVIEGYLSVNDECIDGEPFPVDFDNCDFNSSECCLIQLFEINNVSFERNNINCNVLNAYYYVSVFFFMELYADAIYDAFKHISGFDEEIITRELVHVLYIDDSFSSVFTKPLALLVGEENVDYVVDFYKKAVTEIDEISVQHEHVGIVVNEEDFDFSGENEWWGIELDFADRNAVVIQDIINRTHVGNLHWQFVDDGNDYVDFFDLEIEKYEIDGYQYPVFLHKFNLSYSERNPNFRTVPHIPEFGNGSWIYDV